MAAFVLRRTHLKTANKSAIDKCNYGNTSTVGVFGSLCNDVCTFLVYERNFKATVSCQNRHAEHRFLNLTYSTAFFVAFLGCFSWLTRMRVYDRPMYFASWKLINFSDFTEFRICCLLHFQQVSVVHCGLFRVRFSIWTALYDDHGGFPMNKFYKYIRNWRTASLVVSLSMLLYKCFRFMW